VTRAEIEEDAAIDEEEVLERPEPPLARKMRELGQKARPIVLRALEAMKAFFVALGARLGPLGMKAWIGIVRFARTCGAFVAQRAPRLRAMVGPAPKRRTTAPPPAQMAAPARRAQGGALAQPVNTRSRARTLAIGAFACAAVGFGGYALASQPEAPPPAAALVAPPQPAEPVVAAPIVVTEPETIAPLPPSDMAAPAVEVAPAAPPEPAVVGGPMPPPSYPTLAQRRTASATAAAAPVAEAATAGGAVAAPGGPEVAPAPQPPSEPVMAFGADEVERGRTSTLRMSMPIEGLEARRDASGFTITVRGALSLDRASPIAAANPSIERATIINRGDHCVLTIRFVEGRAPAYRIAARGAALDVTIGR
jgi:hypothetical protein